MSGAVIDQAIRGTRNCPNLSFFNKKKKKKERKKETFTTSRRFSKKACQVTTA